MSVLVLLWAVALTERGFLPAAGTAVTGQAGKRLVIVDAGHGGNDPGKIGVDDSKEKEINLQIAKKLKVILEQQDLEVRMTREEDQGQDGNAVVRKVVKVLESDGNTPLSYMENMYSNLITNPFSKGQYRKFFDILEEQKEGALLWHCSAGKDRVGVATILLLTALGVPRQQILADYEKVNCFVAKDVAQLMETFTEGMDPAARETAVRREALRLLFTVNGAYAESVFAAMERQSGSTEAFLEEEMGLTPERLQSLKDNYLE